MKTATQFPDVTFFRLNDHERSELSRMAKNAALVGRANWADALTSALKADVMTIQQYDTIMGAYRHWLNWGFKDAS